MSTFLSWGIPLRARGVAGVIHFGCYGAVIDLWRGTAGRWRHLWTGVKKPAHGGLIG
ncbi:hypothetical protein [Yersinia bercovieri]|uniref:hypothetical protein n=1 Tax=Yersinia bercovieri TaxID=634 RepID=UPI0029C2CD72|nr:hypothetical protein [Yersinia enterocolitica]